MKPPNPPITRLREIRSAFTLLEMLIVIALLAIFSVSILSLVDQTARNRIEIEKRGELQSEVAGVFCALVREASIAQSCAVFANPGTTETLLLAFEVPIANQTAGPSNQWVLYACSEHTLRRTVFMTENPLETDQLDSEPRSLLVAQPNTQTLAQHVTSFQVLPADNGLLRFHLATEIEVYRHPYRAASQTAVALPAGVGVRVLTEAAQEVSQ